MASLTPAPAPRPGAFGPRVVEWLRARAERLRSPASPRLRRAMLLLAVGLFLGGGYVALRRVRLAPEDLRWLPLVLAVVLGTPLTVFVNALEYRESARLLGVRERLRDCLRISVLGSAANQLPLPGAALVRITALRRAGTRTRHAAGSTLGVGFTWISVSIVVAAGWLLLDGSLLAGVAFAAVGIAGLALSALVFRVAAGRAAWPTALIRVIVVEAASVATAAFRFWLLFLGLSIPVRTSVPFVLPVAGALASAAGVFPSGLGLRELLVALLSPLVGLAPAAGFLASSAGRVCGTVALAPISLALAVRPGRGGGDGGELDLDGRESRNAGGGSP